MKPPILRAPTRDARDADHLAIIAVLGGVYLWWGRAGLPAATAPWIVGIAVASTACGILLWLRAAAAQWLGALVFVAMSGLGVRRLLVDGPGLGALTGILLPLIFAVWMARIDYRHKCADDDEAG